jgi:hypothetical protein
MVQTALLLTMLPFRSMNRRALGSRLSSSSSRNTISQLMY